MNKKHMSFSHLECNVSVVFCLRFWYFQVIKTQCEEWACLVNNRCDEEFIETMPKPLTKIYPGMYSFAVTPS